MHPGQLKFALVVSWLALSSVLFFVLVAPHILPHDVILQAAPACESKARYNAECSLCGMTNAFLYIADGDVRSASQANRAGVALYGVFLVNEIVAVIAIRRLWSHRKRFFSILRH